MKLFIGNKNYSTWSMRAWLALRGSGVPFEEEMARLDGEGWKDKLIRISPTGNVPALVDDDVYIAESLAIVEYAADKYPEKALWPEDRKLRGRARAAACEMHAGFQTLRSKAPMNLRASYPGRVDRSSVETDVARIEQIWQEALDLSGGPFLFGQFSAADAFYAPVAARFETYAIDVSDTARQYMETLFVLPAFVEWKLAALEEPWIVPSDEIDVVQGLVAE